MERNLCLESGCRGFCCEDIFIEITKAEKTRLFPKVKEVSSKEELIKIKKSDNPGIFCLPYTREELEGGDFFLIAINGPCPNRLPNGGCSKHEEREYAARNFAIGCEDCNEIRCEHSLGPIFFEPVE